MSETRPQIESKLQQLAKEDITSAFCADNPITIEVKNALFPLILRAHHINQKAGDEYKKEIMLATSYCLGSLDSTINGTLTGDMLNNTTKEIYQNMIDIISFLQDHEAKDKAKNVDHRMIVPDEATVTEKTLTEKDSSGAEQSILMHSASGTFSGGGFSEVKYEIAMTPGAIREKDEDFISIENLQLPDDTKIALLLLFDGMGGQGGGELASKMASEAFSNFIKNITQDKLTAFKTRAEKAGVHYGVLIVRSALEATNKAVFDHNKENRTNIGCTITGSVIIDGKAIVVNVGDSRTSLIRRSKDGEEATSVLTTTDHEYDTIFRELLVRGDITNDQYDDYSEIAKASLSKSIGGEANGKYLTEDEAKKESGVVIPSIYVWDLEEGDELLLMCDGIFGAHGDIDVAKDQTLRDQTIDQLVEGSEASGDNRSGVKIVLGKKEVVSPPKAPEKEKKPGILERAKNKIAQLWKKFGASASLSKINAGLIALRNNVQEAWNREDNSNPYRKPISDIDEGISLWGRNSESGERKKQKLEEEKKKLEQAETVIKLFFSDNELNPVMVKQFLDGIDKDINRSAESKSDIYELRAFIKQYQESHLSDPENIPPTILAEIYLLLRKLNISPSGNSADENTFSAEATLAAELLTAKEKGFWEKLKNRKNPFSYFWEGKVKYNAKLNEKIRSRLAEDKKDPTQETLKAWLKEFQAGYPQFLLTEENAREQGKLILDKREQIIFLLTTEANTRKFDKKQKKNARQLVEKLEAMAFEQERVKASLENTDYPVANVFRHVIDDVYVLMQRFGINLVEAESGSRIDFNISENKISPEEKDRADKIVALLLNDQIGSSNYLMKQKSLLEAAGYDLQEIIDLKKHLWKKKQKEKGGIAGWLSVANINTFEFLQRMSPLSVTIDRFGRYNATGMDKEEAGEGFMNKAKYFINRNGLWHLFNPTKPMLTKDGRTTGWYAGYVTTGVVGGLGFRALASSVRMGMSIGLAASTWGLRVGAEQYRARDVGDYWNGIESSGWGKKALVRLMKWSAETPNDHFVKSLLMKDNQHSKGFIEGAGAIGGLLGIASMLEAMGVGDRVRDFIMDKLESGDGADAFDGLSTSSTPTDGLNATAGVSVSKDGPDLPQGHYYDPASDPTLDHQGPFYDPVANTTPLDPRPNVGDPGWNDFDPRQVATDQQREVIAKQVKLNETVITDQSKIFRPEDLPENLNIFPYKIEKLNLPQGTYFWDIMNAESAKLIDPKYAPSAAGLFTRISRELSGGGAWVRLDSQSTEKIAKAMEQAIIHMEEIRSGLSADGDSLSEVEQLLLSGYLGDKPVQVGSQLVPAFTTFNSEQVEMILEEVLKK